MIRRCDLSLLLATIAVALGSHPAGAVLYHVPADQPTIQAAIAVAAAGDTVLVAPGSYEESIDFLGKDLVVASRFLFSGDPADIAATVIDPGGPYRGSCAVFVNGETRTAVLAGFTLTGGTGTWLAYDFAGGGIFVFGASPTLRDLVITGCEGWGGGVFVALGGPLLERMELRANQSASVVRAGGGVYAEAAAGLEVVECRFVDNTATEGGGMCVYECAVAIRRCEFRGNRSVHAGGLLLDWGTTATLAENVFVANFARTGGGLVVEDNTHADLNGDLLRDNQARFGGGLYLDERAVVHYNADTPPSIHRNRGLWGRDIYTQTTSTVTVHVDTFSVPAPTAVTAYPPDRITVIAQHHDWTQVDGDLYVAPDGDDDATGTAPGEALRTLQMALVRLAPVEPNSPLRTIHLAPGIYAPSTTGETFPLAVLDRIALAGAGRDVTVIDAEGTEAGLVCGAPILNAQALSVCDLTVTGAVAWGGVACIAADVTLERLNLPGNSTVAAFSGTGGEFDSGAGVGCYGGSVTVRDVDIVDCRPRRRYSGAVGLRSGADVLLQRVAVVNTSTSWDGAGFWVGGGSLLTAFNATITGTTGTHNPAGVWVTGGSRVNLVNTIVWGNQGPELGFHVYSDGGDTLLVAYCDIQGGASGVQYDTAGTLDWREGNLDADPLFADAAAGDISLDAGSPCIDTGTAHYDWGDPNHVLDLGPDDFAGSAPDIGARESAAPTAAPALAAPRTQFGPLFPNPANPRVTVPFAPPGPGWAEIVVYDLRGRRVRTLLSAMVTAAATQAEWDGRDDDGRPVASGTYRVQLSLAGRVIATRPCTLVR